jgi:hypothetical protein
VGIRRVYIAGVGRRYQGPGAAFQYMYCLLELLFNACHAGTSNARRLGRLGEGKRVFLPRRRKKESSMVEENGD